MPLRTKTEAFWQSYLALASDANDAVRRFYEICRIDTSHEAADEGAALITRGVKTTTSSFMWTHRLANKPLPEIGSPNIVTAMYLRCRHPGDSPPGFEASIHFPPAP